MAQIQQDSSNRFVSKYKQICCGIKIDSTMVHILHILKFDIKDVVFNRESDGVRSFSFQCIFVSIIGEKHFVYESFTDHTDISKPTQLGQ